MYCAIFSKHLFPNLGRLFLNLLIYITVVGEPPLCMTVSLVFALRDAIAASVAEWKKGDDWFHVGNVF